MTKKEKRNYFIWFTVLFPVMLAWAYAAFGARGLSLIKTGDSIQQHCRAFIYYGNYLREILRNLFVEHRLELPEWDFSIGYGANILSTFHYYILGDPLSLLSALAPEKYALCLYQLLLVLRHYLAGVTFSCYCIFMGKKNRAALLAGTFTYVFCTHALNMGVWHPFFLNPMIYFPLVLLGAEKIFRGEKPYVLIFSVFLSAVSNFYFFYMIAALTALYVLVRCAFCFGRRRGKDALLTIGKIAGFSFVGVMLSAVILYPVLRVFLTDYRSGAGHAVPLFYGANYYPALLASFTGAVKPEARTLLTYGAAALPAVIFLFLGRGEKRGAGEQKALLLLGALFLLFPFAGHVLNGFSYVANRWTWGYSLLAAFILISCWEAFFQATPRDAALVAAIAAVYAVLCRGYAAMRVTLVLLLLVCLVIAVCAAVKSVRLRRAAQGVLLVLVLVGVAANAWELYTGEDTDLIRYFYTQEGARKALANNPDAVVKELADDADGFFRYTGNAIQENSSVNNGTSNTQFYWSLSNGNIARYFLQTETLVWGLYYYRGLDDRTVLNTLAGCRYYVGKKDQKAYVPYGYAYLGERGGYEIYENLHALPLACTYDSYMTHSDFDNASGTQKEEMMLQSVLLEKDVPGIQREQPAAHARELGYELLPGAGVTAEEDGFLVSAAKSSVTLRIDGAAAAGETHVEIKGFDFAGESADVSVTAYGMRTDGTSGQKTLNYRTAESPWPTGMHDFVLNLGYGGSAMDTVTLTFSRSGKYKIEDLRVWNQPLDTYEENVEARKQDAWEKEVIGTDRVSGEIELAEDKLLLFSIPYDGGWTAYVDGKKQEVLQANIMYSALALPAGKHKIELVYHTPGLAAGFLITLAGVLALLGIARRAHHL